MRKENGITLIALIITIILLLILAGVVISLALGENGLFKTASGAAKKYKLEEMRERIELAISDVVTKEITLENEITVENVLQELLENGTFETIDKEAGVGTIDKYDVTLKKNEDGSIVIESIEETTGVRVTYKLDPKSYTNSEKVTIQFKAVGEVKSVTKPNGEVAYPNQGKAEVNYEVDKNGTYKFIVENKEGIPVEKEVLVDTIDRLDPLDFTITAEEIAGEIKITAKAEDADTDGVSIKSGIARYEYYVKKEGEENYTKYDTNEIANLGEGTHLAYAIAYDKAENKKQSPEIEVKITVKFNKVSVGYDYILAIDTHGKLWASGNNNVGQLGDGTTNNKSRPIQIEPEKKFKEIAAGEKHSLAIDEDGKLWSWGNNEQGQLGNNSITNSSKPIKVQIEEGLTFKSIVAGRINSMAIDENGNLWTWGENTYGQLGNGTNTNKRIPVKIKEETRFKKVVLPINISEVHCLAIDEDDNLWGWGNNAWGQVGDGTKTMRTSPTSIKPGLKFNEVAAGFWGSMAQTTEGELWSWGYSGNNGQLADSTNQIRPTPWKNTAWKELNEFTMRSQYGGGIDKEGKMWTWGINGGGQLGDGTNTERRTQTLIKSEIQFKTISTGLSVSAAIDKEGNLWGWGNLVGIATVRTPTKLF